jgi:hypothetical protein
MQGDSMSEYTGQDWPYEAHQAQKESLKEEAYVLLLGERQDVDAIREITTSYSYLLKFGRPFQCLYDLVYIRPDEHFLFALQESFKHQQYTVNTARLPLLKAMLEQRPTLLYEVVYKKDEALIVERNFEYAEQGTMLPAIKKALEERGWISRPKATRKSAVGLFDIAGHHANKKAKKAGKKPDIHTFDRWWNELASFWRGKKKP